MKTLNLNNCYVDLQDSGKLIITPVARPANTNMNRPVDNRPRADQPLTFEPRDVDRLRELLRPPQEVYSMFSADDRAEEV